MAYSQRFEGSYEYENKALLEAAWEEAFSGTDRVNAEYFTIVGLTVSTIAGIDL